MVSLAACEGMDPQPQADAQSPDDEPTRLLRNAKPTVFVVDTKLKVGDEVRQHAAAIAAAQLKAQELVAQKHHEAALAHLETQLARAPAARDLAEKQALRLIELEVIQGQVAILNHQPNLASAQRTQHLTDSLLSAQPLPLAQASAQALVGLGDLARAQHDRALARASYMRAIRLLDQLRRHEIEPSR